jgi:hypothetical protein
VLVPRIRDLQLALPEWVTTMPFFSGPPVGVSLLTAAVVLAIMIIPFTSSVAREVLRAVPLSQREGAYALGSTRWEATKAALFYARTGIIGAIMLGLGRAHRRNDGGDDGDSATGRWRSGPSSNRTRRWRPSSPTSSPRRTATCISRRSSKSDWYCSSSRW